MTDKVVKSDAEWRAQLTPEQYAVARKKGTEPAFSGAYWETTAPGTYACAACGHELFVSEAKFQSGCGWPSFTRALSRHAVAEADDHSHGMIRTEVLCACCDAHLGHVFDDGPAPTGLRYCINSLSLTLKRR